MQRYHLFLQSDRGVIVGKDEFEAEDDQQAIVISYRLFDACSDRCATFELLRKSRHVDVWPRNWSSGSADHLSARTQEIVLERELALYDSRMAIAASKRLVAQINRLIGELEEPSV